MAEENVTNAVVDTDSEIFVRDIFYPRLDSLHTFILVCDAIVTISGIFANLLVIVTVAMVTQMRTLTNVLFVNLTLSDLLVVVIHVPIKMAIRIYRDWIFGEIMCKFFAISLFSSSAVSSFSILAICINRYIAIHYPLRAKVIFSRRNVAVIIACIWLASFVVNLPLMLVMEVENYGRPGKFDVWVCNEHWWQKSQRSIFSIVSFAVVYVFPLVCIAILYAIISKTLWHSGNELFSKDTMTSQSIRIIQQRRKTVRTLILLVVIFGVCWLPFHLIVILEEFIEMSSSGQMVLITLFLFAQLLSLCNSAINPIVYCLRSSEFHNVFKKACCCKQTN